MAGNSRTFRQYGEKEKKKKLKRGETTTEWGKWKKRPWEKRQADKF
jgi:hypothetical protein